MDGLLFLSGSTVTITISGVRPITLRPPGLLLLDQRFAKFNMTGFRESSAQSYKHLEALRWAAAAGAAVVLTEGAADCHMQDIERIYPDVDVGILPE